jgi:hypothetical protein
VLGFRNTGTIFQASAGKPVMMWRGNAMTSEFDEENSLKQKIIQFCFEIP